MLAGSYHKEINKKNFLSAVRTRTGGAETGGAATATITAAAAAITTPKTTTPKPQQF